MSLSWISVSDQADDDALRGAGAGSLELAHPFAPFGTFVAFD